MPKSDKGLNVEYLNVPVNTYGNSVMKKQIVSSKSAFHFIMNKKTPVVAIHNKDSTTPKYIPNLYDAKGQANHIQNKIHMALFNLYKLFWLPVLTIPLHNPLCIYSSRCTNEYTGAAEPRVRWRLSHLLLFA